MWKGGLVWLSAPPNKVLDLWANLDLFLDPNYSTLTSQNQHWIFLWNVYTLGLKLGGNLVFFGFLGQLILFWQFWPKFSPILIKKGQFRHL